MMDKLQSISRLRIIHRSDQPETIRIYKVKDIFEAETLFPGLKIKGSDLFIIDED
jgi:hypothetical protein